MWHHFQHQNQWYSPHRVTVRPRLQLWRSARGIKISVGLMESDVMTGTELHCLLAVMECQYKLTDDSCNGERKLPAMSNWSSACNLHLSYPRLHWADLASAFLSHVILLSVLQPLLINYGPILNFHKMPQHTTAAVWLINQNAVLDTTEPSLFNVLETAGLVFLRGGA